MEQQDRQGEYHDQTEDQVQVFLCLHFVRGFGSSAGPVLLTEDLRLSRRPDAAARWRGHSEIVLWADKSTGGSDSGCPQGFRSCLLG
jgi:hypothetical protein